jgi:uncharacterized membrane protein YuzA (DUF378 family)
MCKNCGNGACNGCKGSSHHMITNVLLIIGGLNWGLVGIGMLMNMNLNIVNLILGSWPMVEAIIYILVGIAAVVKMFGGCHCAKCKEACGGAMPMGGSMGGGSTANPM